ncbi:Secreted protein containing C-terminal beta-propeller domain [Anaerobranca californiensis DSM 14826]|uniref:Secreted protein containing C-terminal beta-propeller domain n=1 Tax=Anaerobranca californiensis DSM 14826 TaxID=1120989 RepID=A0A1M6N9J2_9FIRM|nr:beta-propeller domain-containing protein [Anaerobranca californiensis]SHJ92405.1 Secreted protein containing C-terminal beta-propeller domain [Anaerobranca californiensis DSM 14826]
MKRSLSLLIITILLLSITGCVEPTSSHANNPLPKVNSLANLNRLLKNSQRYWGIRSSAEIALDSAEKQPSTRDYSSTNVQVKGIDEGDIIKIDGEYLYQIVGSEIVITRLYPVEEGKIVGKITFKENISPQELFIDGDKLVVIGYKYDYSTFDGPIFHRRGFFYGDFTLVLVYDISQPDKPKLTRELEVEGHLLSTRKKDSHLYLITNKYLFSTELSANPAPRYKDSAKGEGEEQKKLEEISYFPQGELSGFINIVAFSIKDDKKEATIETFLGNGHNIYMSHENLYIALTTDNATLIHKFAIDKQNITYKGQGKVSGWVLNQFSMDEYGGYFRIATTSHRNESLNNLYVLDENMKTVGKLENLAPTERIYAARFIGDKAYLITFEIIDPLFVIDLKNPKSPKVLGELKIPGFSNYLHPIDENHLLGIGRDTTVTNIWGREMAVELGIRLTIFDVTDPNNPKEKFVETIGGRGTYSEALYNHKAVYYHNNRLAFPVWETKEVINPSDRDSAVSDIDYSISFIGAYIYEISTETGFKLGAKFSHFNSEQQENLYEKWFFDSNIKRIVSIEDYIYTISDSEIQIHNIADYQTIKTIKIQ